MQTLLISVDLNAHRFTYSMLADIISEMSKNYEIKDTFLFNFNENKHSAYRTIGVTPVHSKPSRKRVQMDTAQALHALEYSLLNHIDAVFIVCGALESEHLFKALKRHGIKVIAGVLDGRKSLADELIMLERVENPQTVSEQEPPEPSDNDEDICDVITQDLVSPIPAAALNVESENSLNSTINEEFLPHAGGHAIDTPQMKAAKEKLERMLELLNTNKSDILKAKYEELINR